MGIVEFMKKHISASVSKPKPSRPPPPSPQPPARSSSLEQQPRPYLSRTCPEPTSKKCRTHSDTYFHRARPDFSPKISGSEPLITAEITTRVRYRVDQPESLNRGRTFFPQDDNDDRVVEIAHEVIDITDSAANYSTDSCSQSELARKNVPAICSYYENIGAICEPPDRPRIEKPRKKPVPSVRTKTTQIAETFSVAELETTSPERPVPKQRTINPALPVDIPSADDARTAESFESPAYEPLLSQIDEESDDNISEFSTPPETRPLAVLADSHLPPESHTPISVSPPNIDDDYALALRLQAEEDAYLARLLAFEPHDLPTSHQYESPPSSPEPVEPTPAEPVEPSSPESDNTPEPTNEEMDENLEYFDSQNTDDDHRLAMTLQNLEYEFFVREFDQQPPALPLTDPPDDNDDQNLATGMIEDSGDRIQRIIELVVLVELVRDWCCVAFQNVVSEENLSEEAEAEAASEQLEEAMITEPGPSARSPEGVERCCICLTDEIAQPMACKFCKQTVGCFRCVRQWYNGGEDDSEDTAIRYIIHGAYHRKCPLCRHMWLLRPEVEPVN